MTVFLTSSHNTPGVSDLNPANGFAEELCQAVKGPCRALIVCSSPDDAERTDHYAGMNLADLRNGGLEISEARILDRRVQAKAGELVRWADFIVLMGGHVPTQNRFFNEIGLRELLHDFAGVILGISAGSMNSADVVYVQPELEGEALDPGFQRFLPGLGLTHTMILPHYQQVRDTVLDGLRLFEEITFPDSFGREFYVFPDGTYLYIHSMTAGKSSGARRGASRTAGWRRSVKMGM